MTQGRTATLLCELGQASQKDAHGANRLRKMVDRYFGFLSRSVRHLGVAEMDVEDVVQKVFIVASQKLEAIEPRAERAFLFQTALRVSLRARRAKAYSAQHVGPNEAALDRAVDPAPHGEDLVDRNRAALVVARILDAMDLDLRTVFILCEIEELEAKEVVKMLDIPLGTVKSRLRRARQEFIDHAHRLRKTAPARSAVSGKGNDT